MFVAKKHVCLKENVSENYSAISMDVQLLFLTKTMKIVELQTEEIQMRWLKNGLSHQIYIHGIHCLPSIWTQV